MRALGALALCLWAGAAMAQTQCPGSNMSWSSPLPAPMQFATFDLAPPPGIAAGLLTVIYTSRTAESFLGVPQTVATQFPIAANPNQFFANAIKPVYHELLLFQTSNCPLLLQSTGALWTK